MRGAGSFRIGDYTCWPLNDGELIYPGWTILPAEAQPPEHLSAPYIAMLVDTGPMRVLIDAGAGALGPDTGKLLESLASTGFSPDDIHLIILSHGHPDHSMGMSQFPNASVVIMRREFEFWTAAETRARLEAGQMYGLGPLEALIAAGVRDHLEPARDRMRLLEGPTEVAAGILVFPAAKRMSQHPRTAAHDPIEPSRCTQRTGVEDESPRGAPPRSSPPPDQQAAIHHAEWL